MKRLLCFLLLLTLVPLSFTPNAAAQSASYLETFESPDLNGDPPEEDWYSFSTSGAGQFRIATDNPKNGLQSYKQTELGVATTGDFHFGASTDVDDLCTTGLAPTFKFWFQMQATAGSVPFRIGTSGADEVSITIGGAGSVSLGVNADGVASTATVTGATVLDGQWYQAEVRFTDCVLAIVRLFIYNNAGVEQGSVTVDDGGSLTNIDHFNVVVSVGDATIWVDDITITGAIDQAVVISSAATASVTNLVGFDVDPTGQIAIARTALGENVQTWNAQTLGTALTSIDTNCAAGSNDYEDAVMAKSMFTGTSAQLVAYLACTVGGDSNQLQIRNANGDVPTVDDFDGCEPAATETGEVCVYDIALDQFDQDSIENGLGQLGQIQDWPIDFSQEDTGFFGSTNRYVTWAFASQQCDNPPGPTYCDGSEPGYVGVAAVTDRDVETTRGEDVQVSPNSDVRDFCVGVDDGTYYLASAEDDQPSHTWQFTLAVDNGGFAVLVPDIITPGSNIGNGALGVGCGGGQILIDEAAGVVNLHTRQGTFLDTVTFSGAEVGRGVAMSEEFVGPFDPDIDARGTSCSTASEGTGNCVQYGVAVVGTTAHILNVTGGTIDELASITLPAGTFHSIFMDRTAQNVWIATTSNVARYHVRTSTTIDPVSQVPPEDGGGGGGGGGGDGLFANSGATVGAALGTGSFGGNLFLGAVLMGLVAYGVGTGYGNVVDSESMQPRALRVNPWAAAVGAAVGFLLAWAFGFFSEGVVFSLIVLVAVIIGIRVWVGTRG